MRLTQYKKDVVVSGEHRNSVYTFFKERETSAGYKSIGNILTQQSVQELNKPKFKIKIFKFHIPNIYSNVRRLYLISYYSAVQTLFR